MADGFTQNKRKVGKAMAYFVINAAFAAMFALGLFTLASNPCYTIKGSSTPVDPTMYPEANDVTQWFNWTLLFGFVFYSLGAAASLGYLAKGGFIQQIAVFLEKVARASSYIVFIAVHVMRLSHTGAVCSGDYLPSEARTDAVVKGYMIPTGQFFLTYIIIGWIAVPALLIITVCIKGDRWASLALDAPK